MFPVIGVSSHAMLCTVDCQHPHPPTTTSTSHVKIERTVPDWYCTLLYFPDIREYLSIQ